MARALVRSHTLLNQAAAICDRPALWTQAKRTISISDISVIRVVWNYNFLSLCPEIRDQPTKQQRRRNRSNELGDKKSGNINWANA